MTVVVVSLGVVAGGLFCALEKKLKKSLKKFCRIKKVLYFCNVKQEQQQTTTTMKAQANTPKAKMEDIIASIAGVACEIAILGAGRVYLSVMFDGNQATACQRLQNFFGDKFDTYEYDEELDATYAGIELEK